MRQTLQVDVLTTKEATVVEVQGTTYAETYQGNLKANGYAKKHPNDEHDAEVGHALAMARALKELAESYERRAWDRINRETTPATKTYELTGYLTGIKSAVADQISDGEWNSFTRGFKLHS